MISQSHSRVYTAKRQGQQSREEGGSAETVNCRWESQNATNRFTSVARYEFYIIAAALVFEAHRLTQLKAQGPSGTCNESKEEVLRRRNIDDWRVSGTDVV